MADQKSIWVGLLDLDASDSVVGVSGPVGPNHSEARVLVRVHGAPLGFVWVPTQPAQTITARARLAAEASLGDALQRHHRRDDAFSGAQNGVQNEDQNWEVMVGCPQHYPSEPAEGITVLICTRDRPELLRECLQTLRQVRYEPLEILVVDNASAGQATREVVEAASAQDPRVRYTAEPRSGKSLALNHGLVTAKHEIVAITDDDVLVDPAWPAAVAAGFAADPKAVCVTGLVASSALDTGSQRYFDARYPWGEVFEPRRYDLIAHRHPSPLYPFSAGTFGTGANCAFRRSAVTQIGGFDPLLGAGSPRRGGADLDMFLRLILAGGRICYLPSALVWHKHRSSSQALAEQVYSYGHGLGAYLAKHFWNRELRTALLGYGLHHTRVLLGRQRQASRASQLGADGRKLALYEAWGVMPGAVRYWRAARRVSGSSSGTR
jgi:O-antigen biosynthesis protein